MKKLLQLLAGAAAVLLLSSCLPKRQASTKLRVVTTVPVVYDWTRNIIDENTNTTLYLSLIVKNGLIYHEYIPSDPEKASIQKSDLFIYVGGPSEQWAKEFSGLNSLNLMELTQATDEHFVLSPKDALTCCDQICEKLCQLDPANAQTYKSNYSSYKAQLELLDSAFVLTSQKATDTTLVFCDRLPFRYIFDQYGIKYISCSNNCPAPELNIKTIDQQTKQMLGSKIDEFNATAVYVTENSDKKLAKEIISFSKNPKCDTIVLDSMESTTLSQLFSGKNYINTLRNDLTLLQLN